MCHCLGISRSTYYYRPKPHRQDTHIEGRIIAIFKDSHHIYGARKIKAMLWKQDALRVSRRRIRRVMNANQLVSVYTKASFKPGAATVNKEAIPNILQRQFSAQRPYAVVTSDVTYVKVKQRWHYICLFIDLFNREIIGYSAGQQKSAQLVYDAIQTIQTDLRHIQLVHSDRGSEFNATVLNTLWRAFGIKQSLSQAGCPYDNAVSESTFHILKTECIRGRTFESLAQLRRELAVYVYWYNTIRIHGSLAYQTPVSIRQQPL